MAEMLGPRDGTNGGRGGSMNVTDLEHGLIGCFGIVGGSIAAATGAALAAQLTRDGSVAVAFFGDGAVNQAYFHECLNFAAVRRLPVVYVCENNLYGEWTPMASVTAGADIAARAAAYGMSGARSSTATTCSPCATRRATALARARGGDGPTLLECLTYRHKGTPRSTRAHTGRTRRSRSGSRGIHFRVSPSSSTTTRSSGLTTRPRRELEQVLAAARAAAFPRPGAPATATKGAA